MSISCAFLVYCTFVFFIKFKNDKPNVYCSIKLICSTTSYIYFYWDRSAITTPLATDMLSAVAVVAPTYGSNANLPPTTSSYIIMTVEDSPWLFPSLDSSVKRSAIFQ